MVDSGTLMVVAALLGAGAGPHADAPRRELLADRHFQRGFTVWAPEPGKIGEYGKLRTTTAAEPAWTLAQWSSNHPFATATPIRMPSGAQRFETPGKAISIGKPRTADADLSMAVYGQAEYDGRARKAGEPWVHLLAGQAIAQPPRLTDLKQLVFCIDARLRRSTAHRTPDYSPNLHAAQFQAFLTVQNLNRASTDYGRLLWFGIPLYDDRYRVPPEFTQPDQAGLFIYTPRGDLYTSKSLHDGQWVGVRTDVLPMILDGLRAAWGRGFLSASHDLADYRVAAINVGWEVPGLLDVEMQVRDLSLSAVTR